MPYEKVKVYFDGSHYIGIPQSEGKSPGKGGYHGNENDEMRTAFEKAYKGAKAKKRKEKVTEIVAELKPQFENEEQAAEYVKAEMERIQRNLIVRRKRLTRKINLGNWNYFARSPTTIRSIQKYHSKRKCGIVSRRCAIVGIGSTLAYGSDPRTLTDCISTGFSTFPKMLWLVS